MNSNEKKDLFLSDLINDVRDLYCKTGNKKIEGLFITLAQNNDRDVIKWISSNRKIKDTLKDPEVYEALIVLIGLRKEYPTIPTPDNPSPLPFSKSDVVSKVMNSPNVNRRTSYFLAFYPIVRDLRVREVLNPFEDILRVYHETLSRQKNPQQKNPMTSDSVIDDLTTINSEYRKSLIPKEVIDKRRRPSGEEEFQKAVTKPTKKQKKQSMYEYLRDRFTREASEAAFRSQFIELGKKISSEMLLTTPLAAMSFLNVAPNSGSVNEAKSIAREVLANLGDEKEEQNYEMVKSRAMKFSGLISTLQLLEFYGQKEKYGVEKMKNEDVKYPSISVMDSHWVNPKFLYLLCSVLTILKNEADRG